MQHFYSRLTILLYLLFTINIVIAGEFEDKLKAAGISQEAIDILLSQEYSDVEALRSLTVDNLVNMKIKRGAADKIVAHFGKKESQPFEKMSLGDLLTHLSNNPSDENALKTLKQHRAIQEIASKTPNWAIVNIKDRKLDVQSTLAYLEFLKTSAPKTTFRDKAVVSIDIALGRDDVILEHPLLSSEKLGVDGIDSNGLNWLKVAVEVRKALFWMKIQSPPHSLFPTDPEAVIFDLYREAGKNPLEPGKVQKIVSEFQAALLRKDTMAMEVQMLKMPE